MVGSEPSTNARRCLRQVAIALVFSALTVASACTAQVDEAPPTAESTRPTVAGATTARPLATPTPVLAPASATPAATPAATSLVIVATDGDGVAVRDACDDARRTSAPGHGLAEGTTVLLLARGEGACIGWMLIQAPDRRESWVRTRYLAASPLDSSASQTATPPPPTPARGSTQTPTVTPQPTRAPVATRTPTTALEPTAAPATQTPTASPEPTVAWSPEAFHCHCRRVINDGTRCDQRFTTQGGPGYCHTGETHDAFNTWPPLH